MIELTFDANLTRENIFKKNKNLTETKNNLSIKQRQKDKPTEQTDRFTETETLWSPNVRNNQLI